MNFLGMGPMELLLILILALIIFGPQRLPELMGQAGKALRDFQRATSELSGEFNRTIQAELEEAKAVVEEARAAVEETKAAVQETKAAVADVGSQLTLTNPLANGSTTPPSHPTAPPVPAPQLTTPAPSILAEGTPPAWGAPTDLDSGGLPAPEAPPEPSYTESATPADAAPLDAIAPLDALAPANGVAAVNGAETAPAPTAWAWETSPSQQAAAEAAAEATAEATAASASDETAADHDGRPALSSAAGGTAAARRSDDEDLLPPY